MTLLIKQDTDVESNHNDWHFPKSNHQINSPICNNNDLEGEEQTDVLLADPELQAPPMYAVIMYNDDYTPMDFVVMVLMEQFRKSEQQAVEIMLAIHHEGQGIAGIYPKDIAETKAQKANMMARKEGFPLLTQIEPYTES